MRCGAEWIIYAAGASVVIVGLVLISVVFKESASSG